MASDSRTPTIAEKEVENKVNEEAKLMEKESVSSDMVIDKPRSDLNPVCIKEEEIDQTVAGELEKESPAVVKAEESAEKHENGEKVAEQVELKEPILVKKDVEEVHVEAVDVEKPEEKPTVESVVEEDNKDKEETKIVDVSDLTGEAEGKQVEPVDIQFVKEVSVETTEDKIKDEEVLGVKPKLEASEKVKTQPEKAKELEPEVEVVKEEETSVTPEQAKVEGKLEDTITETKDEKISASVSVLSSEEIVPANQESDTNSKKEIESDASSPLNNIEKATTEEKLVVVESSKDEKTIESGSVLCPEEIVPVNQDSEANSKKEIERDASARVDVIEKAITEEKQVVDEPSKDETTSESGSALCPEKVVPTDQVSNTEPKKEDKKGASSLADAIKKTIAEEKHVVEEPSKDETTSESGSALCPETVVRTNQTSDTEPKKETQQDTSLPPNVIEKAISEEKRVVEEPSKEEQENVSEAKDVVNTKLATEGENKKDTEPAAADDKIEETLKETETESKEKETTARKQEESITQKAAEVVETSPTVKESDEQKQQLDITAKEASVKPKSNSIISKVKQSFVKAKKAIIGKSPSSKTITTEEAKGEIQVE